MATLMTIGSASAGLVINETLADPNGPGAADFDANADGTFSSTQDEYIEFVNDMATALDISGWTVDDAVANRHTFAAGTILAPGQAFVLFGGGSPNAANFGGALVGTASTGFIGLNNGGDTVSVFDAANVLNVTAPSGTGDGVSSTRDPDLTGSFVLQDSLAGGLPGTPGFENDGTTPFASASVVPEPSSIALLGLIGLAGAVRRRR